MGRLSHEQKHAHADICSRKKDDSAAAAAGQGPQIKTVRQSCIEDLGWDGGGSALMSVGHLQEMPVNNEYHKHLGLSSAINVRLVKTRFPFVDICLK